MDELSSSGFTLSGCSASPSQAGSTRKVKSLVWDYFMYHADTNKSVCQIEVRGSTCGKHISGKNPTNLKQHMKSCHVSALNEFLRRDEALKKSRSEQAKSLVPHQLTVKEVMSKNTPYSRDSHKFKIITRKLALYIGSSNIAYRTVENYEFRDLVTTLDPRYVVPGRTALSKELSCVLIELKAKISAYLESANKISICCDVWSKKGLTSSYLGVTGHFFSHKNNSRHTITLAVRRIKGPHTADNIRTLLDEVLMEWGICDSKLFATLTDNGSNMVAAFKTHLQDVANESEDDYEIDEMEHEICEEVTSSKEKDFIDCEEKHDQEFVQYNRISCFCHTIQLVVNKFDECSCFSQLVKRTHALVRRVNSSTKATERLIILSGKKLTKDCPIRWSSTFLMINRLLEVKHELKVVLDEQGWDDLAASEWKMLQSIVNLLHPFARLSSLLSGDEYTTLSCVIPAIVDLNIHLEEVKLIGGDISNVACTLQSELQQRFRKYTAPGTAGHHPLMLASTFLDVRYRLILNPVQCESAKTYLSDLLKKVSGSSQSTPRSASPHGTDDENEQQPQVRKRFKHLGRVLELKIKEGLEKASSLQPGKTEINHYSSSVVTLSENEDPISFWLKNQAAYPLLSSIAVDLLCIPASSAPVERTFSTAGEVTAGRRNRLANEHLEREILIRKNRKYFTCS